MINVLFLCRHNAARSIMAEAVLNDIGSERFRAYSAGVAPTPDQQPHPTTLRVLTETGLPTEHLRSKSWSEFSRPDAPHMDLVITVCDFVAGEPCPVWPGHPASAHWDFEDPSLVAGGDDRIFSAFHHTLIALHQRLEFLVNLPPAKLERTMLQTTTRALNG